MEVDKYDNGVPGWVDLGTPDLDAARGFYSALFGWDIPPGPEEAGGYSIAMLRGKPVAGLGPAMNPGPPVWATYVIVDSADDTAKKVKDNGGAAFVEPMDVLDAGRMAVFADPQGAVFSVWQAGIMPGAGIVNEPNSYSWSELVTSDIDAAKKFYGAVFGWGGETYGEADGPMGGYTEWKLGERSVGGMMTAAAAAARRGAQLLGRVLRGRGHRGVGREGEGARRFGAHGADGHRARHLRHGRRPPGRDVQRDAAQRGACRWLTNGQSVERTVRPARAPVCSPSRMNTSPFTIVVSKPAERWM